MHDHISQVARPRARRAGRVAIAAFAAAALGLTAAGCSPTTGEETGEETYTLSWTSYVGPDSHFSLAMNRWVEEVEARTDGRVQVETFVLEALCATLDGLACVKDGRADIAYTSVGFHPAEFPMGNVVTVPFLTENPMAPVQASEELYATNDEYRAQFENQGLDLLYFTPTTPAVLGTKEATEDISWLASKSVRGNARLLNALDLVGANAVSIPIPEIYESIDRGVIDAWFAAPLDNAILDYKLGEVTSHMADTGAGTFTNGMAVINSEVLASLPEDIQAIIAEVNAEILAGYESDFLQTVYDDTCAGVEAEGVELSIWSDAAKKEWRDRVEGDLFDGWASEAAANGVSDPQGFFDEYSALAEGYDSEPGLGTPIYYCLNQG
jgi:TRAP-type C4-dicarboxylate transport system substrate-binding protein